MQIAVGYGDELIEDKAAMEWSAFLSAVVGGILVLSGHVVVHVLKRRADAEDKKDTDNEKIAVFALDTVNWLEMDKQVVFAASGNPVEAIQTGNPIHALVALIKIARPDLNEQAAAILTSSRKYFDLTRILIPSGSMEEKQSGADEMANLVNGMMVTLNTILDAVCPAQIESR